jgi:hypothetical protein
MPDDKNDLLRALESGDFISIGSDVKTSNTAGGQTNVHLETNIEFSKMNMPIGIDFGKTLPPLIYLTSVNVLEKIAQLPGISNTDRFELESLKNLLFLGKVADYIQDLDKIFESNINLQKKDSMKNLLQPFVNVISFLLENFSQKNTKFVKKKDMLEFLDAIETKRKAILSEWKNNFKYPIETVEIAIIIETLIWFLIQRIEPEYREQLSDVNIVIKHGQIKDARILLDEFNPKIPNIDQISNSNKNTQLVKKNSKNTEKKFAIFISETYIVLKALLESI